MSKEAIITAIMMIGNLKKSAISIVKREKKCEVKRKVPIDIDLI